MEERELHRRKLIEKINKFDAGYQKAAEKRKQSALKGRDYIIMLAFFAAYLLLCLINLGGTQVPKSYWETGSSDYVILRLPQNTPVKEIWCYKGIDFKGGGIRLNIYLSDSAGEIFDENNEQNYSFSVNIEGNIYRWFEIYGGKDSTDLLEYQYLAFTCESGARINEMVLLDGDRNIIDYTALEYGGGILKAFDEKQYYPSKSLMTDMYFDEIYHARTAFEHIMGWEPYEITHPPLGKIIISLGIRVFGMNPLGWRISGVVFSALLSAALYALGKNLFLKRRWAVLFAFLGCLDGLHFVQGRIATIDTYIVFFSTVSVIFMIKFFRTNILRENALKCLAPFALSGIFFGFAVSSKWTGIYTGAGLFALFVIYMAKILNEYRYKIALMHEDGGDVKKYTRACDGKIAAIIFTGIIFFVIIPFITYLLCYLPYLTEGEKSLSALFNAMWDNQKYMLYYHGEWVVDQPHQCSSPWFSWPVNYRSVYMYKADETFGAYARIHSMGNHAIMWTGIAALFYCAFRKSDRQTKLFLFAGFLSALLPWVFVKRTTFIYHFYPAMPYYIGMIVYMFKDICKRKNEIIYSVKSIKITKGGLITGIYAATAALNFILLYPVYAGLPVSYTLAAVMFMWLGVFGKHVGFF